MRITHLICIVAVLIVTVIFAGCTDRTRISKILNDPDRYANTEVAIAGTISNTYAVNLIIVEAGAYQVDDGSGKIWVITKSSVPKKGTKVGVKGTVSDKIDIFGLTDGLVIEEKERRTRN